MLSNIPRRKFLIQCSTLGALGILGQCKAIKRPLLYFIGDSLTKGIGTTQIPLSYPYQTANLLNNIDFEVFGYPGISAHEYYKDHIHNLIISFRRDITAIVFLGANDLTELPVDKVYNDIVNVHHFLNEKNVKTITVPVLNRKDRFAKQPEFDRNRLTLNTLLKTNYKTFSAGFVSPDKAQQIYASEAPENDIYFKKKDSDGLSGVHLTDVGAAILARAVAEEITRVINNSPLLSI